MKLPFTILFDAPLTPAGVCAGRVTVKGVQVRGLHAAVAAVPAQPAVAAQPATDSMDAIDAVPAVAAVPAIPAHADFVLVEQNGHARDGGFRCPLPDFTPETLSPARLTAIIAAYIVAPVPPATA